MNRTALRLATLASLTNGGAKPWPTLAKDNVYDSRRDPHLDIQERMRTPVIVIRTDDDARSNSMNNSYTERQARSVDLMLELSVVTAAKEKVKVKPDDPNSEEIEQWVLWWPQTDAALEAMLDMLEYQIENALLGMPPWALWWKTKFGNVVNWQSRPEYSRDPMAIRLAARTVVLSILMPRECLVGWRYDDEEALPGEPPPLLQRVFDKVSADGSGALLKATEQIELVLEARGWPTEPAYPQFLSAPTAVMNPQWRQLMQTDLRKGLHKLHHSTRRNSLYWALFADEMWYAGHRSLQFTNHVNSQYIPLLEDI